MDDGRSFVCARTWPPIGLPFTFHGFLFVLVKWLVTARSPANLSNWIFDQFPRRRILAWLIFVLIEISVKNAIDSNVWISVAKISLDCHGTECRIQKFARYFKWVRLISRTMKLGCSCAIILWLPKSIVKTCTVFHKN